tara:strand:+ start:2307 stop:2642 length:336 start_codon:yes stop_codon:yes gene_type:complete
MRKVALLINDHRWIGYAEYFGEAYFSEFGMLRIPFTISDKTLQQTCIEFEPIMTLAATSVQISVFQMSNNPNPRHIERLEELLARNAHWKKTYFAMAAPTPIAFKIKKTSP